MSNVSKALTDALTQAEEDRDVAQEADRMALESSAQATRDQKAAAAAHAKAMASHQKALQVFQQEFADKTGQTVSTSVPGQAMSQVQKAAQQGASGLKPTK